MPLLLVSCHPAFWQIGPRHTQQVSEHMVETLSPMPNGEEPVHSHRPCWDWRPSAETNQRMLGILCMLPTSTRYGPAGPRRPPVSLDVKEARVGKHSRRWSPNGECCILGRQSEEGPHLAEAKDGRYNNDSAEQPTLRA